MIPEEMPVSGMQARSLAATRSLGQRLGRAATQGDVILLTGRMGGGKTTLTQGIASGLGYVEVVNSPTFTLLKEHHGGRMPLFHFDLYRLDTPDEMWDLGFEEYFGDAGLSVVEWAERAPDAWETLDWLWIALHVTGPTARRIDLRANGPRGRHLLAQAVRQ